MGLLLFQNDACMVINKLPGESSESPEIDAAAGALNSLTPVHRLDVPVSGCQLLAKNAESAAFLGAAFASRDSRVEKRYWAIVEKPNGLLKPNAIKMDAELVHWISIDKKTNKSFACPTKKNQMSKKAVLRYRVAGEGKNYLFLEIDLVTGRHHQIRAQLAAVGLHIKGDLKYGAKRSEKAGGIRLHAYSLAFPNPLNSASPACLASQACLAGPACLEEIIRVTAQPPLEDSLWAAFSDAPFSDAPFSDAL